MHPNLDNEGDGPHWDWNGPGGQAVPHLPGRDGRAPVITTAVRLDDPGRFEYVRGELAAANPLGRLVLSVVEAEPGTTVAIVPEPHGELYAFRHGIFPKPAGPQRGVVTLPSTASQVSTWVLAALRADVRACFVCESYLFEAPGLSRAARCSRPARARAREFVYHWAMPGDSPEVVAQVVGAAYPRPLGFSSVLSILPPAASTQGLVMGPGVLEALAAGTQSAFIGAYDGESVVVWTRRSAALRVLPEGSHS